MQDQDQNPDLNKSYIEDQNHYKTKVNTRTSPWLTNTKITPRQRPRPRVRPSKEKAMELLLKTSPGQNIYK